MKKGHYAKEEEILRKPIERVSVPYMEGLNDIQVQERVEKGWNNHVVESPEKTNKQIVFRAEYSTYYCRILSKSYIFTNYHCEYFNWYYSGNTCQECAF